ncbi:MAG: methylated-DNA--[protein]-cysteine S-methyltransferase [Candidatus Manganitrophus sp. SB1]|nr:methylated-DNA--[protein]-cysteine S-methyltransferase [Candidatus Manganitrophus morganii]
MNLYTDIDSPLGPILLVSDGAVLTGFYFVGQKYAPDATPWKRDPGLPLFRDAEAQIAAYTSGKLKTFNLPIRFKGTPFQLRVWQAIAAIPFGATQSYSVLAARIGAPSSMRAVGAATGRNPISLIVPCHRVVGRDGALTGYAGGLDRKRALLDFESGLDKALFRPIRHQTTASL